MLLRPPEILITTPESLNLLLSSPGGMSILTELATVILDEIHTVVANKRGVHLITAVDRLVPLSGEFQRIGISATVNPMKTVAEFLGGFQMKGDVKHPRYIPRAVTSLAAKLGIDIGALDEVVMIQSPPSISSAVQRIGRAGHQVGETSRGIFYPTFDQDFLEAAVEGQTDNT